MDGAYFVCRKDIISWINNNLALNVQKVEEICNGCVALQLLDSLYPAGKVPMSKINWAADKEHENLANYKILQKCFAKLKIEKEISVGRLVRGRYQDNFEFMQWLKYFHDKMGGPIDGYDPVAQRAKGRGAAIFEKRLGQRAEPRQEWGRRSGINAKKIDNGFNNGPNYGYNHGYNHGLNNGEGLSPPPGRVGEPTKLPPLKTQHRRSNIDPADGGEHSSPVDGWSSQREGGGTRALKTMYLDLRTTAEGLERERNFYFDKLRDLELLLQEHVTEQGSNPFTDSCFKVLYATTPGFVPIDDDEASEANGTQPRSRGSNLPSNVSNKRHKDDGPYNKGEDNNDRRRTSYNNNNDEDDDDNHNEDADYNDNHYNNSSSRA